MKTREELRKDYESACNNYLYQLLSDWGYDYSANIGWWVGDDVGGIYCLEDDIFIRIDDIVYCVDNNISKDDYTYYTDYTTRCNNFGLETMNLNSFIKGAPRISDESFETLEQLKLDLENAIENTKENLK